MPNVSMTKAASLAGVSKATLSKALKTGRLSYVEKSEKGYLIDTSELFRVFPVNSTKPVLVTESEPSGERGEAGQVIELLKEQLRDKDSIIADLREDRDIWRAQATGLLSDQRPKGFWTRLFGKDRNA